MARPKREIPKEKVEAWLDPEDIDDLQVLRDLKRWSSDAAIVRKGIHELAKRARQGEFSKEGRLE